MLVDHVEKGADMTVSCLEVPIEEAAGAFGVMKVDEGNRVIAFEEKPEHPSPVPGNESLTLASMGNYIFNTEFLFEQLLRDSRDKASSHDFGKDILPAITEASNINAYPFRDPDTGERAYWRDVGTLDSFWIANIELIDTVPPLNIYDEDWPIWTYQEQLPPAKFVFDTDDRRGMALESMVSGGCIISGATLRRSVLFSGVRVEAYAQVEESVILPDVHIGAGCRIRRAIVDRACLLPDGLVVGFDEEQDRANGFRVTAGGRVLVTRGMLGQPEGYA